MNFITVCGNICRDAQTKFTPSNDAITGFSVADNQGKDKPAIFWECDMWGKRGEALAQYLKKGGAVTVIGQMSVQEYTNKDGEVKKQLKIKVSEVALQGGRTETADQPAAQQARPAPRPAAAKPAPAKQTNFSDIDDDIPF